MKKIFITLFILFLSTNLFSHYSGIVFVDKNKNGIYDKGEKLLEHVMITDGLNVVKTNSRGEFELQGHEKARFITITTPTGYKVVDSYYIPIKSGDNRYNFALEDWDRGINQDGSHQFIQLSDTEISDTIGQGRWASNVKNYAQNEQSTFVIHTGDICYESGLKSHINLMNNKNMGCPMYYIIGNHDLVKGDYGEQLFESIYGPTWFSFDYGNVHYVVTPMAYGDYSPSYKEEDVYEWLKNDLSLVEQGTPIICFNHDLISSTDDFWFRKNANEKLNLSDFNIKAWLYGHWHNNFVRQQGKVKTISTATLDKGGIDHSTNAFRVVSVNSKGDVETQLRYTYIDKHVVIASIDNENASIDSKGKISFIVNTYNSTSNTKSVTYSLKNGDKTIETNKPLTKSSDWSWQSLIDVSSEYTNQQLSVEVTALFNNGEIAKAAKAFTFDTKNSNSIHLKNSWTTLLGNSEHNGRSSDTLKMPLRLSWVNNIKTNIFMASPLVYNNSIYIAAVDEDLRGKGGIYALDAQTGQIRWFFKTRNSIKNSIAIESDNVFAQDAEGYLYAVNTLTGQLSWEQKLQVNGLPVLDEGLTSANGIVYAGSGRGLAAYDAKTGQQKWINTSWEQREGTTSTIAANSELIIGGAQWRGMYANDIKTGKLLWEQSGKGISNRASSPVIHDSLAYFISFKSLFILDVKSGDILMSKELPFSVDVTSTPLITDKFIVFGTVDNGLIALDKENYSEKWRVETEISLLYTAPYSRYPVTTIETSPVLVGKDIVFGASDGFVYVVDIENGKIEWKHNVGAPIFNTIATSGNTFFVADFGGNVYAFTSK